VLARIEGSSWKEENRNEEKSNQTEIRQQQIKERRGYKGRVSELN
jgi:hypothetical protein